MRSLRGRSRRSATRRRTSAASPRASPRRASCPRPGSSSTTAPRTGRASSSRELAHEHPWIRLLLSAGSAAAERGAPDRPRARTAAIDELSPTRPTSSSTLDADISFEPDYFARLLDELRRRPGARDRERQLPTSSRTATGASATSPARPSGAPRAATAGSACRRSSRSRSGSAGTASTSSRPTPAAGGRGRFEGPAVPPPSPRGRA